MIRCDRTSAFSFLFKWLKQFWQLRAVRLHQLLLDPVGRYCRLILIWLGTDPASAHLSNSIVGGGLDAMMQDCPDLIARQDVDIPSRSANGLSNRYSGSLR
jgi:hypothetical protein